MATLEFSPFVTRICLQKNPLVLDNTNTSTVVMSLVFYKINSVTSL